MSKKIILVICVWVFKCTAQTFDADMEEVYKNFVQTPKISYKINYVLRENHDANSHVISAKTGKFIKTNQKYLSVYDSKSTLMTAEQLIMIDKEAKRIRVKKLRSKTQAGNPDFVGQLREYNKNIAKTTKLSENGEICVYDVKLKTNTLYPISHYEISIDKKTNYLKQMVLFYTKPLDKNENYNVEGTEIPRLEIIFSDYNDSKLMAGNELDTGFYYSGFNKQLIPSTNFKGYDVKEIF